MYLRTYLDNVIFFRVIFSTPFKRKTLGVLWFFVSQRNSMQFLFLKTMNFHRIYEYMTTKVVIGTNSELVVKSIRSLLR